MLISDWSSDLCSSDLQALAIQRLDHADMEQPERRTARQHQRRTTEAELDLLKEFQLGGMRQFRQFHLADPLQRGCHFTRVIGDQLLGDRKSTRLNSSH